MADQTLGRLTMSSVGHSVVGGHTSASTLTLNIASGSSGFGGTLGGSGTNENNLAFTKTGAGTFSLSNDNTFSGTTKITGGTLIINSISSISGGSSAIGAPTTVPDGLITLGGAATTGTLRYTGGLQTTNRTIQIGTNSTIPAITDIGGSTIENNGTGALTFSAATFNTRTNAVAGVGANRTLTLQGTNIDTNIIYGTIQDNTVSGSGTGSATISFTKAGAGKWELGGDNSYTGGTSVTGGTLSLSPGGTINHTASLTIQNASVSLQGGERINNSAPVSLNGGSLLTNGHSETLGTLTLSGGSNVLNLGSGTSIVDFADSSGVAGGWSGTLQVWNWNGNVGGGGTNAVFFGDSNPGLSSGQVAKISFLNPAGYGNGLYGATLLSSGELVPVPEPTALAGAAVLAATALAHRRRAGTCRRPEVSVTPRHLA